MKSSYVVAIAIAGAASLWLASSLVIGSDEDSQASSAQAAEGPRELFAVSVANLTAQPMVREIVVNGRTEAKRSVDLRAEVRGQVEAVLAEKGAMVKEGDVIARIAVDARRADLEEAKANLALRRIEFDAATKLGEKGFTSDVRRAEAKARLEAAQAQLRQAELALEKTEVRAPFEGVLDARPVDVGDYVDTKDPVGIVVDLDPIRFVASVTERNVADLKIGNPAIARTLTGEEVEGTITFIASRASEAARTFLVEVEAPNPDRSVVAGLTATLRLPVTTRLAHKVSPAMLTLDDAGIIGVKTVDADGIVQFQPVTILGSEPDGVWLGGLPEQVTIVVVGQEFIVPGEKVKPVPVEGGLS